MWSVGQAGANAGATGSTSGGGGPASRTAGGALATGRAAGTFLNRLSNHSHIDVVIRPTRRGR
jgi:hypothetical protein